MEVTDAATSPYARYEKLFATPAMFHLLSWVSLNRLNGPFSAAEAVNGVRAFNPDIQPKSIRLKLQQLDGMLWVSTGELQGRSQVYEPIGSDDLWKSTEALMFEADLTALSSIS